MAKGRVLVGVLAGLVGIGVTFACSDYAADEDASPAHSGADSAMPDGNTADGGAPLDAPLDDATAEGGDAAEPCPDGGFCDSFERTDVIGPWNTLTGAGPCTASIDGANAAGGTSSLRITMPELDAGLCERSVVTGFTRSPKKVRLAFAVRISSAPGARTAHFGLFKPTDAPHYLFFALQPGGLKLAEQEPGVSYTEYPIGGLSAATWHRVVLDIDVAGQRAAVSVDGIAKLERATAFSYTTASFEIYAGVTYSTPGAPLDMWFDDVRISSEE